MAKVVRRHGTTLGPSWNSSHPSATDCTIRGAECTNGPWSVIARSHAKKRPGGPGREISPGERGLGKHRLRRRARLTGPCVHRSKSGSDSSQSTSVRRAACDEVANPGAEQSLEPKNGRPERSRRVRNYAAPVKRSTKEMLRSTQPARPAMSDQGWAALSSAA